MFTRLGDECNHSSGSSTDRTPGTRLPSVAFGTIVLFKVDVRVDTARCDVSAANAGGFAIFDTDFLAFDNIGCVALD